MQQCDDCVSTWWLAPRMTASLRRRWQARRRRLTLTRLLLCIVLLCHCHPVTITARPTRVARMWQLVSGVSAVAYWLSTYAFDALSYLVPAGLCLALIYIFKIPAYTQGPVSVERRIV